MNSANFQHEKELSEILSIQFDKLILNNQDLNLFSTVSASITQILSNDIIDHTLFYRNFLYYQKLVEFGKDHIESLKDYYFTEGSENNFESLRQTPQILTTFHFGSYLLLARLLASNNIEFAGVISAEGYKKSGKLFSEILFRDYNIELLLIDAEKNNAIISMVKQLRRGKILLMFLDLNKGLTKSIDTLHEIDFLNCKLKIRKGAGYISHIAKVPISTCFNFTDQFFKTAFHFSTPLKPVEEIDRDNYAKKYLELFLKNLALI